MDESTDGLFHLSVHSLNEQKNKLNNCYIRANPNKNTEDAEDGTGTQEEEKCIHHVLENKWQIIAFLVLVHTIVSKQEEEVVVKT